MRILIDIQGMQSTSNRNRGIGRYTRSFTHAFLRAAKEHDVYLLLNGLFPDTAQLIMEEFGILLSEDHFILFDALAPASEIDKRYCNNARVSELIREKMIEDLQPDLLLLSSLFEGIQDDSITSIGTYSSRIPTAVIFYDLIPYMRQEEFLYSEELKAWYMRKIDALKRADSLLAISFSAQNEASVFLGRELTDIVTISSATDESFYPQHSDPKVLQQYGITRPFLMHTSAYEPRKNFEGLIEAFGLLPASLRQRYQLLLVCKLTRKHQKHLEDAAQKAGLREGELILTGYVPDDDLISLYTQATLFVFPSRHEGFGLPPLEAMACGTATIGSDISSIPEVIGREDALFDPIDTESIAKKIEEILTDNSFLASLEAHALRQAGKFTWDSTAQKALAFLEEKYAAHSSTPPERAAGTLRHSTNRLLKVIAELRLKPPLSNWQLHQAAQAISNNEKVILSQIAHGNLSQKLSWRIEGPFDSSYSLSLLNRETARALDTLGIDVALHSTEGPGDFDPDLNFLAVHPDLARFNLRSQVTTATDTHVCSRNLYPPRVEDMHSLVNMLHHYAWEESGFPHEWVNNFNASLEAMTCLSHHVEKIMVDNGVNVPLYTSGCGVDHWERISPDKTYQIEAKSFRFLHVSSCFPRKGADILLKAYGEAFSQKDDVTLIIKTFPNPHNDIHLWLENAQGEDEDYPDVMIIEEDLTDAQLKALYEQCHTLIAPSRAEGFGLPMAEAMLSGLAVITTGWGGQLDFCNSKTSWLIDYKFTPAQTHFELFDSVWAEPSKEHLSTLMREIFELPMEARTLKSEKGRTLLLENFKWVDVTQRLVDASHTLTQLRSDKTPKIGWVSSWNTRCGIAAYSEHLIQALPQPVTILAAHADDRTDEDKENVYRCWHAGDGNKLDILSETIEKLALDTIVVQFNYSFFDFTRFNDFLTEQKKKGRTVIVMMHATTDADSTPHKPLRMLADALKHVDRLLVHSVSDLNHLKAYGLVNNVALFPHGIPDWDFQRTEENSDFLLASYGFLLPHKGLLELIEAFKLLLLKGIKIKLKMINAKYPVPQSDELHKKMQEYIEKYCLGNQIELITDYLSDEKSLTHLSAANLLIFPYQETGESSSAAVRYGLATGKPVAVTPLKIFDDVNPAVFKLSGYTPAAMAESIHSLIKEIKNNSETVQKKNIDAIKWRKTHQHSTLGTRLYNMITALKQIKSHSLL